jgi:hypothetical protein
MHGVILMRMMPLALFVAAIALAACGLSTAWSASPDFLEVKDTGSGPGLMAGIVIDCENNNITISVHDNETDQPVGGAKAYLFYTNYGYQAIGSGTTESDGIARIAMVGKRDFLTSLFVLRVEKAGYMSREIEFTYRKCLEPAP